MNPILPRQFYYRHPIPVAKEILGKMLVRRIDDHPVERMITETEGYGPPSEGPAVRLEGIRGLELAIWLSLDNLFEEADSKARPTAGSPLFDVQCSLRVVGF